MKMDTSSGDNEAVEHQTSTSNNTETEPVISSGQHIDDYTAPYGEKMSFFYFSNHKTSVWVQFDNTHDRNIEKPVPLWMKELKKGDQNRDSVVSLVNRYLRDKTLRPEYCRIKKQVRFFPVNPKDKLWMLEHHCLTLSNKTLFVYRSNGSISYVSPENQIITWDWKSNTDEKGLTPGSKITALVDQNGHLIVGCEDGSILKSNGDLIIRQNNPVVEIVAIGDFHFAVRCRNNSAILINLTESYVSNSTSFNDVLRIWSVRDRFFILLLLNKVLQIVDVHDNTHDIISSVGFNYKEIYVSDTVYVDTNDEEILIWEGDNSWNSLKWPEFCSIWRSHRGLICKSRKCSKCSLMSYYSDTIQATIHDVKTSWEDLWRSIKENTLVFSSPDRYIFPKLLHVTYFSKTEPPITFHVPGNWRITSMTPLSDGSIMFATDKRGSGIHVITKEWECVFSSFEQLTKDEQIISLREMTNGSVATVSEFWSSVCIRIITPRFAYQTYLDGLESAIQARNLYQARRFYEKAINIFSDRDEPMRLFLSHLIQFPNNKIERSIKLDLFELFRNKKCKRRLFIGEGDFTYTESLINTHIHTHEQLAKAIVATEFLQQKEIGDEVQERINSLKEKGVQIFLGIDGKKIHEHSVLKDLKFERVHWNCPFGDPRDREAFRSVIPDFFLSCGKIQSTGDRVHVTLIQGWNDWEWNEKRQYENPIVKGSIESGYSLIRKRRFGEERYPNYVHRAADGSELTLPGVHREFVFEKNSKSVKNLKEIEEEIVKSLPMEIENAQKKYFIKKNSKNSSSEIKLDQCYFECSTDDDSSEYYSDSD